MGIEPNFKGGCPECGSVYAEAEWDIIDGIQTLVIYCGDCEYGRFPENQRTKNDSLSSPPVTVAYQKTEGGK